MEAIGVFHNKRKDTNGNTVFTLTCKMKHNDSLIFEEKTVKGILANGSNAYAYLLDIFEKRKKDDKYRQNGYNVYADAQPRSIVV